jgi:hypothetical protein
MVYSPMLPVHIGGGVLGILSGAAALAFRKGSPRHALAGKVFVWSMLVMASAALYLAILKDQTPNVLGGVLTIYLITTGWLTARGRENKTSFLTWGLPLIPLAGSAWGLVIGVEKIASRTPPDDGVPLEMNLVVGFLMLLAGGGDIRMMLRGLSGTKRLVRHLWRMCAGLFVATGSFFLGQQRVFPPGLRGSILLTVLGFLPLAFLIFWLLRVRFGSRIQGKLAPQTDDVVLLPTLQSSPVE